MDGEFQEALADIGLGLDDLTADLEDLRDEIQDRLEEKETPALREAFRRAEGALNALYRASSLLDGE